MKPVDNDAKNDTTDMDFSITTDEEDMVISPVRQVKPVDNDAKNDTTDMDWSITIEEEDMEISPDAYSKQMLNEHVNDIDKDDHDNPQLVSGYVNEIYAYLRQLETRYPIRSEYLVNQTELDGHMRGILIDWLVQVHLRFHLLQETLYLTVAIMDRYLQVTNCYT